MARCYHHPFVAIKTCPGERVLGKEGILNVLPHRMAQLREASGGSSLCQAMLSVNA